ncbi:hypothetical protein PROFUN_11401 [Planoprotostelium fungivorum]|uniref:Wax synthase domain-containing protein n=1 Tax=Planoprotostelium fungivorum TaxID=1890364 RepID=A0A2P6NA60_9EUKA|nr:hypothetical protein PROFUN_11401 [Planoprotostelium fungivorum]
MHTDRLDNYQPVPGTVELTPIYAILPPLVYLLALILLPPLNTSSRLIKWTVAVIRNILALLATILFLALPLHYHVRDISSLTYLLSLIGCFGACRIVDIFFINAHNTPRRIQRKYLQPHMIGGEFDSPIAPSSPSVPIDKQPEGVRQRIKKEDPLLNSVLKANAALDKTIQVEGDVLYQKSRGEVMPIEGYNLKDRILWAIDLEIAMRGVGWDFTTADIRHGKMTWLPTAQSRIRAVLFKDTPMVMGSWYIITYIYNNSTGSHEDLPLYLSAPLTLAHGVLLFSLFALAYDATAAACAPLGAAIGQYSTHNLAYWPPLNSLDLLKVCSVRSFWSRSWHRLFARMFLIYGVKPGQWIERKILGENSKIDPSYDVGKVLGAFFQSGMVHGLGCWAINGGDWRFFFGEWRFFAANGLAVVVEELFRRLVRKISPEPKWYDRIVGIIWTLFVLIYAGNWFTRGWWHGGLIRELTQPSTILNNFLSQVSPF